MDEQTIERIAERVAGNMKERGVWGAFAQFYVIARESVVDVVGELSPSPTSTRPTVQLRIPAIVRSDAKWAAQGCDTTHLQDQDMWHKNMAGNLLTPSRTASERRIVIIANAEVPEDAVEVEAEGVEGVGDD